MLSHTFQFLRTIVYFTVTTTLNKMNQNKPLFTFSHFHFYLFLSAISALFLYSCDREISLSENGLFMARTPREAYLASLAANNLTDTQLGKAWRRAGEAALKDSVLQETPFQETGYFRAEAPEALAYRLNLQTGELLEITLSTDPDSTLFFVDFYQEDTTANKMNFRHLFSAGNYQADSLTYEVEESGTYLLRIQPELLASCRFNLQLIVQPAYGVFPVSGKQNRDIWSFFGDPRDGGRREHKGVDIFARRGTPVVAAVDGVVRRVRDRGLGGKQVWLSDLDRRQSLYYAHLDSQLVVEGQNVVAGDTLGLVGNTGNARNTRPHLHFGIYRRRYGALDPFPFIAYRTDRAPTISADTSRLGDLVRVRRSNTGLLAAPQSRSNRLASLDQHFPLQIIAASNAWFRVRSPEGISGYLPAGSLEPTERPIRTATLEEATELLQAPSGEAAPLAAVAKHAEVAVIGRNGNYQLVRDERGTMGWMPVGE